MAMEEKCGSKLVKMRDAKATKGRQVAYGMPYIVFDPETIKQ